MGRTTLTRKMFMTQCAAGFSAIVLGCGGDDGGDDTGASSTGASTGSGPTSGSSMSSDPSDGSTSEDDTSGGPDSSGDPEGSGSSSSGSSGSDSGGPNTTGGENVCTETMITALISMNHGHALEVPLTDIEAGIEKIYDASGDAGHCHEVTLTEEDFATLRAGGVVTKYSCNGGDHEYVLSCAADPPTPGAPDCGADPNFGECV
jgi:hypothetical protein